MMDFKRRGEVDADAFGDMGLRKELRRMEEVLLRSPVTWKTARTRRSRRLKSKEAPQVCESPDVVKSKRSSRSAIADFKADRKAAARTWGGVRKISSMHAREREDEKVSEGKGRTGCMRELTTSDEDVSAALRGSRSADDQRDLQS